MCRVISKSSDSAFQPRSQEVRYKCAVLLMGKNSVRPWTTARTITCKRGIDVWYHRVIDKLMTEELLSFLRYDYGELLPGLVAVLAGGDQGVLGGLLGRDVKLAVRGAVEGGKCVWLDVYGLGVLG